MPGSQYFTNPAPAAPAQSGAGTSNAFLCTSQADMLASYSSDNDICIRTDLNNQCFVLVDAPSNILSNWIQIKDPQAAAAAIAAATAQTTATAAATAAGTAQTTATAAATAATTAQTTATAAATAATTAQTTAATAQTTAATAQTTAATAATAAATAQTTATAAATAAATAQTTATAAATAAAAAAAGGATPAMTHAQNRQGTPQVFSNGVEANVQMAAATTVGAAFGTWSAAGVFTFSVAGTYQVNWHHSLLITTRGTAAVGLNIESTLNSSTAGQIDGQGTQYLVANITLKEKFTGQTIRPFAVGETLTLKSKTTLAGTNTLVLARNDGYGTPKNQAEMMIQKIA